MDPRVRFGDLKMISTHLRMCSTESIGYVDQHRGKFVPNSTSIALRYGESWDIVTFNYLGINRSY